MHTRLHSLGRLTAIALLVGLLLSIPMMSYQRPTPVLATASCPNGTGYGGEIATFATSGPSQAGHGCVVIVHSDGTDVFTFTGTVQQWTVPADVTSVELHVVGAGGGGALQGQGGSSGGTGGGGGYATGTLTVVPGDVYDIIVGQGGRHHCYAENVHLLSETQRRNFSFGGGAAGYGLNTWDCAWASGGGRSAVRTSGGTDDIITAGGGGGGGYSGNGGAGGGLVGQDGDGGVGVATQGKGGTQIAGGAGGVGEDGYPGIQYAGGPAGFESSDPTKPSEGGGGGGGYFGGGGGGNNAGGGGGSSFVGTVRGLQSGSTTAGNRRLPGAVPPVNTALPTITGTACIGAMLTATSGSFTGATSQSFKWQSSPNGTSWTDIAGATGSTHTISTSGYVRAVDVASNLFGSTSANSSATAAIDDTTLSALAVSSASLSPTFDSGVFSYTASVTYSQSTVTITPTRSGSLSTITVDGATVTSGSASDPISLAVGANSIEVVTTNGSCSTTTSLTVTRQSEVITPIATPTISTTTTTIPTIPPADDPGLESNTGSGELPETGTDVFALIRYGFLMLITGAFLVLRRRRYI